MRIDPNDSITFEELNSLVEDLALVVSSEEALKDINKDMYKRVALACIGSLPMGTELDNGQITDSFIERCNLIEEALKVQHNITSMPTSYRTAKSVLLKAAHRGVSVWDEDGNVVGKSELEKRVRNAIEKTDSDVVTSATNVATPATSSKSWQEEGSKAFKTLFDFTERNCPEFSKRVLDLWDEYDHDYT